MITYKELALVKDLLENKEWDSLLIDKRDPITYRLFIVHEGHRYCLHHMRSGKTKSHPHKYNARVKILAGRYEHTIFVEEKSAHLDESDRLREVYRETLHKDSSYCIEHPEIFHSVEIKPFAYCYSLMINDYDFKNPNPSCISTAGNNLGPIPEEKKQELIKEFKSFL